MKLLQQSEIHAYKAQEAKAAIDQASYLAEKVDQLRKAVFEEEKRLKEYREQGLQAVKSEIRELQEEASVLKSVVDSLKIRREELSKPLTEEWDKLAKDTELFYAEKQQLATERSSIEAESRKLTAEKAAINKQREIVNATAEETNRIKKEAQEARRIAQGELAAIQAERTKFNSEYQHKLSVLSREQQRVASDIEAYREFSKALKNKEAELKMRERKLVSKELSNGKLH